MLPEEIAAQVDYYADHFEFRHFYLPYGENAMPGTAPLQPWDRLIFILDGEKQEPMELDDGFRKVCLHAGDCYLIAKNRNEFQSWMTPHKMLCIIPRPGALRVAVHNVTGKATAYDPEWTTISHSTGRPPGNALISIFAALKERRTADGEHIPLLLRAVLKLAARECGETASGGGKALTTYNRLCTYLENHFHEPLTREQTAALFELNPQYVSQLFTRFRGESFLSYLTRCRLERARELLCYSSLTVKEVAMRSGFGSEIYFIRRFRELTGCSPGRYRLAHGAPSQDATF